MKYLMIIMVLALILVGGGVFFGLRTVDMTARINELELNYAMLQSSHGNLKSSYNALEDSFQTTMINYNSLDSNYKVLESYYNTLDSKYQSLESDYFRLESNYESLESDHASLKSEHDTLKGEVSSLKISYNKLQDENRDLQRLLSEYENVPHSYYSSDMFKHYSNTWAGLSRFLTSEFKLPRDYEENVFDCSESSAYLEWALENAGFDAELVIGDYPEDPDLGRHAWVIVYTEDYKVAIEATVFTGKSKYAYIRWGRVPGVVYGEDEMFPWWKNYYEGYDENFRNIYIAIRDFGTGQEWNWWEGVLGFE